MTIVIVNWNTGELLRRCLESISRFPPRVSYKLIVVDNASTDGSGEWLESSEARRICGNGHLRVIKNLENAGFGAANNAAFVISNSDLILLLNPDTEVQPEAIDRLIDSILASDEVGASAPRLLNPDGTTQPSVGPGPRGAWYTLVEATRLYRCIPQPLRGELLLGSHWHHRRRRVVRYVSGAALLVKRAVIEQLGGFDERFYMYGEDVELCFRIVHNNWKISFEPDATVIHQGSGSARQRWPDGTFRLHEFDGYCRFRRLCLTRPRAIRYLAEERLVYGMIRLWRVLRRRSTQDIDQALRIIQSHLAKAVRGDS